MAQLLNILGKTGTNGTMWLADLKVGEEAMVVAIKDPQLKLALLRIGLIEGDRLKLTEQAPLGGPMAFRVRGGKVAMRRSDAIQVEIRQIG